MSFDSASVRLRRKAVKQLKQTNAQQLEIETKKMEERIRALKEQMMREKEEREKSGGIKWNSSKSGSFVNGKTQQETKRKSPRRDKGPRRIKMLSDEPLSSYVRKSVTVESQNDVANTGLGVCGQCERTRAGLVCIECGENYCTECFKTFHQKGALKRHTVKSFKQDDNNHLSSRNRVPSQTTRSPGITSDLLPMQNGSTAGDGGGSLLKGSYNEEESSASFAQALREWRNSQTVKSSNSWVNRTDNIQNETSVGVSCGSSTVAAKLKEVKIEFQENNTLSYMDRLMLKKNRKKPLKSVTKPFRPISIETSSGKERKPRLPDSYPFSDNNESTEEFGLNYKEMLLNVCSPARRLNHETGNDGSCLKNQFPHGRNYCRDVKIEEIPVSSDALDETSACIVEEANEGDSFPQSMARPSTQCGRVSIMTLTSTGDFREDAEVLTLEDVSSLSSGSPGSESRTPVTQSCDPLPPRRNQTGGKLSVGSNVVAHSGVQRVWSAMASYTGLSSFFLSGVKNVFHPAREQTREDPDRAISSQTIVSLGLLNKAVWKPEDSVIISDVTDENSRENSSSENVYQPLPIIQAPESRNNSVTNETVSVVLEEPKNSYTYKLKSDWSQPQDTENSHKIHDFGIVDFLQTGPIPSKGQSDYNLLHRVSTVSPLALSPNPPKLNWSDNESDDDFIEEVVSRAQFREGQLRDKQDQDADDTATLNDLAWELQSTSGNRSPTLEEIECFMATQNALEQGMDQFNRDSIDEDDLGTELEEIDYDCDSIDEVDEDRASRMDVAALE